MPLIASLTFLHLHLHPFSYLLLYRSGIPPGFNCTGKPLMKPRKLAAAGGAGDIVGERYFFLVFFLVYLGRCALNLSIEPQCHFLANLLGTTQILIFVAFNIVCCRKLRHHSQQCKEALNALTSGTKCINGNHPLQLKGNLMENISDSIVPPM